MIVQIPFLFLYNNYRGNVLHYIISHLLAKKTNNIYYYGIASCKTYLNIYFWRDLSSLYFFCHSKLACSCFKETSKRNECWKVKKSGVIVVNLHHHFRVPAINVYHIKRSNSKSSSPPESKTTTSSHKKVPP